MIILCVLDKKNLIMIEGRVEKNEKKKLISGNVIEVEKNNDGDKIT